jgi:O-methyltransferase involved in polyketide biosynthesis
VDVDPVLLALASATFADDDRVRIVCADLNDPSWVDGAPEPQVDAVLTATALHWLPEDAVRRLYGDLAGLVRRGEVVAHTEQMQQASRDPALVSAMAERHAVFDSNYPTDEFSPPADWHTAALREAGFTEVGVLWRSGQGAVVAAVR